MRRILILGGTAEAAELAKRLHMDGRVHPVTSLAGRTRSPRSVPGERRLGGFGGADGLAAYLAAENIFAVVDATHPFAIQISAHAGAAAETASCPLARLARAPWEAQPGDDWRDADSVAAAAEMVPPNARVFVTTGRQELAPFFARTDVWLLVRVVDPLAEPLARERGTVIAARGPFSVDNETALMRNHRIDWLVSKNSGGGSSYGKIKAARTLGAPVIMVQPPVPTAGGVVCQSAEDVIEWLDGLLT